MDEETKKILKNKQRAGHKKAQSEPNGNGENQNALLLDASGAAGLLGFTRQYFYQLQSSGRLGPMPIHFGKRTRWSRFELVAWVKSGCPAREKWFELMETESILK
jgi:predicted DNA-binding transcriptional regulator AlpA